MQTSISLPARDTTVGTLNTQLLADRRESRLRLTLGALITLAMFAAYLGVGWDIQWHTVLGRDTFFIPPHMMLYSGVGIAGLVCLFFVLFETWRYYRHDPAVTDATTTRTLRVFHAPLGFIVAGFGALSAVCAAPLDDYWHQLYGLDVTIWAPFHVMGLVGAFIITLGAMYIYASEVARVKQQTALSGPPPFRLLGFSLPEIGLIIQANIVLGFCFIMAIPGLQRNGLFQLFGLNLYSYGLFIAFFVPLIMIAALRATRHVGIATAIGLVVTLSRFIIALFVPWATQTLVSLQGPNVTPHWLSFTAAEVTTPAWLIVGGLLIDGSYLLFKRRANFSWNSLLPALLGGLLFALFDTPIEPLWRRFSGIRLDVYSNWQALALITLLALPVVAIGAWLGKGFGAAMRTTKEYRNA